MNPFCELSLQRVRHCGGGLLVVDNHARIATAPGQLFKCVEHVEIVDTTGPPTFIVWLLFIIFVDRKDI